MSHNLDLWSGAIEASTRQQCERYGVFRRVELVRTGDGGASVTVRVWNPWEPWIFRESSHTFSRRMLQYNHGKNVTEKLKQISVEIVRDAAIIHGLSRLMGVRT